MDREGEFREFVRARSQRLLGTAYLLTGDKWAAEDLLQTALAKAWSAWRRVRAADNPEAYVRKILVNTYAAAWRRKWRGEVPTEVLPEVAGPDGAAGVDERDRLWRAVLALPRRQRAVVVLRYWEDLPETEVARILGVSVGTVKSQCAKALAKLREDESLPVMDGGAR